MVSQAASVPVRTPFVFVYARPAVSATIARVWHHHHHSEAKGV